MVYASMAVTDGDGNLQLSPGCFVVIGAQAVVGPRQGAISSPSGGSTQDEEARVAINAVIAVLMTHGLIE